MNNTIHNTPEGYTPYRIFVFVFPAIVDFSIIFTGIVCIIYHREKYTRRYTRALLWSTGFFFFMEEAIISEHVAKKRLLVR